MQSRSVVLSLLLFSCAMQAHGVAVLAQLPERELTLGEFLDDVEGRLVSVRRLELRQVEAREKIRHLGQSRAFELDVDGTYQGQDLDRLEINGNNTKVGRLRERERTVRFSLTRPLLGQSLEDRLLAALERQRLADLEFETRIEQRQAALDAIDGYLDLFETQEELRVAQRGVAVAEERVRVLTLRTDQGESLARDRLQAESVRAKWRLSEAKARRRHAEALADLNEAIVGQPLAPFRARSLDWQGLIDATGRARDAPPVASGPGESPREWTSWTESLWYNIPELDLTLSYEIQSRDRTFADELRRERGHAPEVELTLELPLDFFRAARAFRRQLQARQERRWLDRVRFERRLAARQRDVELAIAEAQAALELAESEFAYQQERLRVTRLRVRAGEVDIDRAAEIVLLDAELDVLEADSRLAIARSQLAGTVFEYEIGRGRTARDLLSALERDAGPGARVDASKE